MEYTFPQYRKLANNRSLYRVESTSRMVELQKLGQGWTRYEIEARILPDRNLILDLLELSEGYETASQEEFERVEAAITAK